jgi:hypothetical protein
MIALLAKALREPISRKAAVSRFQEEVWHGGGSDIRAEVFDLLRELAYDLDYFEVDPAVRKEDGTYYGHKRLVDEIRSTLRKLRDIGVELPTDFDVLGESSPKS